MLPHTGVKWRRVCEIFKVSGYPLFREIQKESRDMSWNFWCKSCIWRKTWKNLSFTGSVGSDATFISCPAEAQNCIL